jgi:excisionase family DNA binding protein
MAATFYTTRDLQELLHVDRTTIYRMADAGRLPALKVGNQWRFPRRPIDQWLDSQNPPRQTTPEATLPASGMAWRSAEAPAPSLQQTLPLECVQLIQDSFAEALGVMIVITDLNGRPITRPSHTCGLIEAVEAHPGAYESCLAWWAELSRRPSMQPTLIPSHLGLLCTRAFIRSGHELRGMVVFGGIAPEQWPPSDERLVQTSVILGLPVETLETHVDEVFRIDEAQQQRLLDFVQRFADIITHILGEREQFHQRLAQISVLSQR